METKNSRSTKVLLFVIGALAVAVASLLVDKASFRSRASAEWAQQILEEPNDDAAISKRREAFEKLMKDRGPGPSEALKDFKISGTDTSPKR